MNVWINKKGNNDLSGINDPEWELVYELILKIAYKYIKI
jgi:hypothetical protein